MHLFKIKLLICARLHFNVALMSGLGLLCVFEFVRLLLHSFLGAHSYFVTALELFLPFEEVDPSSLLPLQSIDLRYVAQVVIYLFVIFRPLLGSCYFLGL